jgi:hypothetical protein
MFLLTSVKYITFFGIKKEYNSSSDKYLIDLCENLDEPGPYKE